MWEVGIVLYPVITYNRLVMVSYRPCDVDSTPLVYHMLTGMHALCYLYVMVIVCTFDVETPGGGPLMVAVIVVVSGQW